MLNEIIQIFWFLLPAALGNIAPVLFKWVPLFNIPVDCGLKFRGKRLLGSHKTVRGYVFSILLATLTIALQKEFAYLFPTLINYAQINVVLFGFLMGFGAMMGDSIKSFFKRQKGIRPGKPWIPFDQIDWIIGALVFSHFYTPIPAVLWIYAIIIFGLLDVVMNYTNYLLGFKKVKI